MGASHKPKSRAAQRQSRKYTRAARIRAFIIVLALTGAVLVALAAWRLWREHTPTGGTVDIPHLHGLGFSADGEQLIVPAHDGLRIYTIGGWQEPDVPVRDYMGYNPVDSGFYSSGHPGPGSGEINPLGLVKSTDGGQTLTGLGFEGVSDFHLMGVGYYSHAIYVYSPASTSPLPNSLPAGLHYSLDDGNTWQQCALNGIAASLYQIAVHPTEAGMVALATQGGLFLSNDFGDTFSLINAGAVTAAVFAPNASSLLFGALSLSAYDLESGQTETIPFPALTGNIVITNIAVNPVRSAEIALATSEIDVFLSRDRGATWEPIAKNGRGVG